MVVERIEQLEYDLKMIGRMAPVRRLNYIRKAVGYDDYLREYAENRRMKAEDLLQIADQLQESASSYKTMDAWQDHMREYGEQLRQQLANRDSLNTDCVSLMTMHSSKGLEFPIVYILDANEGVTPHHKAVLEADLEEERRDILCGHDKGQRSASCILCQRAVWTSSGKIPFYDEYLEAPGSVPGNVNWEKGRGKQ